MHLAYLCADPGIPVFGTESCSIQVQEFLRALLVAGNDVTLLAARVDSPRPIDLACVTVEHFPVTRSRKPAVREREAYRANELHLSVLRSGSGFDLIYERQSLWSYAGMAYAREAGIPGILEVNSPLNGGDAGARSVFDRKLAEDVRRRNFSHASVIVAMAQDAADYVSQYPEAGDKIVVVPDGTAQFQRRGDCTRFVRAVVKGVRVDSRVTEEATRESEIGDL